MNVRTLCRFDDGEEKELPAFVRLERHTAGGTLEVSFTNNSMGDRTIVKVEFSPSEWASLGLKPEPQSTQSPSSVPVR